MPLMLPLAAAPMAELRQCVRAAPPARLVERSLHLLGVPIVKLEPARAWIKSAPPALSKCELVVAAGLVAIVALSPRARPVERCLRAPGRRLQFVHHSSTMR